MMIGQNCDEHDGDEYFALGGGAEIPKLAAFANFGLE
jgi:hypothetical protein